jgi:glycosyltransferase involved in cell wall biosynthesis
LTVPVPRHEFLDLLNISKITIFLPNVTEGLHLPPLEGMRLGTFVICPDVPGVRDVCKDKYNCFSPKYNIDEIIDSLRKALNLPNNERNALLSNAKITTESFELETERKAFVNILNGANELW